MRTHSARKYGLFEKLPSGQWVRISIGAYDKSTAKRLFHEELTSGKLFGRPIELRPVKQRSGDQQQAA